MKSLILLSSLLVSHYVSAAVNLDCKATAIYGGPLEESFSMEEYPEVSVTPSEVSIGSSNYSKRDGNSIKVSESATKIKVVIVTKYQDEEFDLTVDKKTRKGTIFYKSDDTAEDMADIRCR